MQKEIISKKIHVLLLVKEIGGQMILILMIQSVFLTVIKHVQNVLVLVQTNVKAVSMDTF